MRKQLDPRIPSLITSGVSANHRSFFVLVGDRGKDQVVNLHFLLSQTRVSARPSVLWCYKKDLGFTSHRKKREAKLKRDVKRGIREVNEQSPFELFVSVTDIRYTYYKDTDKVLGQTFGMLVLQDFEAITPNLLARTVETVEGGGIVVLLLRTMSSLKQLYDMSMDVHARYRTDSHSSLKPRFNERFLLSLSASPSSLFLDDELNVLPVSAGKDIVPGSLVASQKGKEKAQGELMRVRDEVAGAKIVGELVGLAKTVDQAKAILSFTEAITAKTLSSTVTLTAGRGRGKSAALGLSIAASLAHGYSNIFVTSPSPENLKTLFEFVFKGLDALGYEEHQDYDILQSTKAEWKGCVVRVNVHKGHRQTIQYIQPQDAHVLGQAELVIIDEAAAIPLPLVRQLIGPYLVFMASTINGYEGTGRSLSIKLIQQLRESTRASATPALQGAKDDAAKPAEGDKKKPEGNSKATVGRSLREIKLDEPIRYAVGDPVERWLNTLLCLDASLVSRNVSGCPHPAQCNLYHVSRDTLFSFHPASELFLQRMMALYVSSHYKNSPNDLQLMSDAPAHELFVLLPPIAADDNTLPEPLVVLQVAMEGRISKDVILEALARGERAGGDLIPWLMAQQFQDDDFAMLSGARVVRIATHPDYANMGYGARALQELDAFYSGELSNLDDLPERTPDDDAEATIVDDEADGVDDALHSESLTVRPAGAMPPLLQRLSERRPPVLDYIGVSYGLTPQLLRFWKRSGFVPLYLRQTANDLTGEHSCVMLKALGGVAKEEEGWLEAFATDFRKRFLALLSYKFREFTSATSLSIIDAATAGAKRDESRLLSMTELSYLVTPFDLKRLESYAHNTLDYHVILDLLPTVAAYFFDRRLAADLSLSPVQASILLGLGLQRKSIEDVALELGLPVNQALALFIKAIRKLSAALQAVQKKAIADELPAERTQADVVRKQGLAGATKDWKPMEGTLEAELEQAGDEATRKMREMKRAMIDSLDLDQYAIDDSAGDWAAAQAQVAALAAAKDAGNATSRNLSSVVSVKAPVAESSAPVGDKKRKAAEGGADKKAGKKGRTSIGGAKKGKK